MADFLRLPTSKFARISSFGAYVEQFPTGEGGEGSVEPREKTFVGDIIFSYV
jgi:hypothetical protein